MTLVETAVATTVMVIMVGLVAVTVDRSNGTFETVLSSSSTQAHAQRAIERVAAQFMDADRSSLTLSPTAPLAATTVGYQRCEGYRNGALVVGGTRRVYFELDPGESDNDRDDDSDGLVDEGRVVLATARNGNTDQTTVLVEDVAEYYAGELANSKDDNSNGLSDEAGFCAEYDSVLFTLTLRLSVATIDTDGKVVVGSAETSVRIRND